jgi:hypothetical protein
MFTLFARDADGTARTSGGDDVRADLTGASGTASASITDCGDGTYTGSATPPAPGTYSLTVTVDGAPLPMCPLPISVRPSELEQDPAALDSVPAPSEEQDGEQFKVPGLPQFVRLLRACREYNVPLAVPEVVVCGTDGYEQLVEALWGVYPLDLGHDMLRRPLLLSLVYCEDCRDPRVTLKRDRLLGANVAGGMRDMQLTLGGVREYIEARNKEASSVPVSLQIESAALMTCSVLVAPSLPPRGDPLRGAVEQVLDDLLKPASRRVLCVLPCAPWKLV